MSEVGSSGVGGFNYFGRDGSLILEIGPHVISENPALSQRIGQIAVEWAQVETTLTCIVAQMIDASPERTFALLQPYRNAGQFADGALQLASAALPSERYEEFKEVVKEFKRVRDSRNRVQHDLWARRGASDTVTPVKPIEYSKFYVRLIHAISLLGKSGSREQAYTALEPICDEFDSHVKGLKSLSVSDLDGILSEIRALGTHLILQMATQLRTSERFQNIGPEVLAT